MQGSRRWPGQAAGTAVGGTAEGAPAERTGRPADDFAARVMAGAVIGAALAATDDGPALPVDRLTEFDRALGLLQDGLPVGRGIAR